MSGTVSNGKSDLEIKWDNFTQSIDFVDLPWLSSIVTAFPILLRSLWGLVYCWQNGDFTWSTLRKTLEQDLNEGCI